MFEQLFIQAATNYQTSDTLKPRKGVIVGTGQVGMACAYSMLIQNCVDELILLDINQDKVDAEVMDLQHGLPFLPPTNVATGSFADNGRDADIVIITAGAKQKPEETRLQLVDRNVEILKNIMADVVKYSPHAIILIASNPVDIMTYVALKLSGLPSERVIGTGTVLDTARFRTQLANRLGLDPHSVHGYIIGEHGDSEVPVWSKVNVAGMPLHNGEHGAKINDPELMQIFDQVKNAAYEIIRRKGYTSYAIGLSITEIVQAILRNQQRVLTVSRLIENFYDFTDICFGFPAVVNCYGATKLLNITLDEQELRQLQKSASVLRDVIDTIQW